MFTAPYTDQELIDDAKNYSTRAEWRTAGESKRITGKASPFGCAIKRGRKFMAQCCAHMTHGHAGHTHWQKYSDDDLLASARRFQTRGEWKNSENKQHYEMALRRPIWDECVAHMRPAANPFAKDYIVYAYEFSDGYCYVGLTFVPDNRKITHAIRGPVFKHSKTCPNPEFKVLESGLAYTEVGAAETKWQAAYAEKGWKPLHVAKAGSLGSMHRKWTKDAVIAKAREFKYRDDWFNGDKYTYLLSKRMGWFDDAAAHMPRRKLGVGVGREVSQSTRDKQAAAKTGVRQSKQHRDSRSIAVKKWWAGRRAKPTTESVVDLLLGDEIDAQNRQ